MTVSARAALTSLTAFFLLAGARIGSAQAITEPSLKPQNTVSVSAPEHVGPTSAALSVAVRNAIPADAAAAPKGNAGLGQNEALMIVGGAAVLVGAIVGGQAGDVFMIGGAIVGLYGLYKYLQ
jgi:hypothetical protein